MCIVLCPICDNDSNYNFSGRDIMFNKFERYDYYHCNRCDFTFQYPTPYPEKVTSFYPKNYMVYNPDTQFKNISSFRKSKLKCRFLYQHLKTSLLTDALYKVLKFFDKSYEPYFKQSGRLLDVGCANGRFLNGMKQLGWEVKGVEFNEGAVNLCRQAGLDVHYGDLFSAKFDNASFDVINVSHVIEHVPDIKSFFNELARILKDNGTLIIKTPNSNALGRKYLNIHWYHNDVPRHLSLFSEKSLITLGNLVALKLTFLKTRSSPKALLRSLDYANNSSVDSTKIKWKRLLANAYVYFSEWQNKGDELFVVFIKHNPT